MLINADLSQIEIVVFCLYCKDKTLRKLLCEGRDIHRYTASIVFDIPENKVSDKQRKDIKATNFGIIYGNGAFTLSQTLGISIPLAKEYIESFYQTFPGARTWHKRILEEVNETGQIITPTSRLLCFTKFPAKFDWQEAGKLYYNPPDIKNWPVQSLAGDIYKLWIGGLYRDYTQQDIDFKENCKIINTIHDSVMLDCSKKYFQEALNLLQKGLDKLPEMYYTKYKKEFDLPLKYAISVGQSWYELKPLEVKTDVSAN